MDVNAIFEKYTREQLIDMLMKDGKEILRRKHMLTACGEEMHRLGSDKKEILDAIEADEAKWISGYCIGSYNQMRGYILDLEKGLCLRPKHIDDMFKARSDYVPQASETKSPAEAMRSLQNECIELRQVMIAAAEEIHEHWDDHCDEDGYGPANLQRRLEQGVAVCYPGYTMGAFQKMERQIEMLNRRLDSVRKQREREASVPEVEVLKVSRGEAPEGWAVPEGAENLSSPWKAEIVRTSPLTKKLRLVVEEGDEVRISEIIVDGGDAQDKNLSVLYQFVNAVSRTMHMKHKWPMWWKLVKANACFRLCMTGSLSYTIEPATDEEFQMLDSFFKYLGAVYD
jgi:hypothetical protein